MKFILFILIIASTVFAVEQYYAESSTFTINSQNENTYSAESQTFSINFTKPDVYFADSATFVLTGIDEIPEPHIIYFLLFILYYSRKFNPFNL